MAAGGAAAAGAAAAALAQAIKASGVLVSMETSEFLDLLARAKDVLVISSTGGLIWTNYSYMFSYKGFAFYTKSNEPLDLPSNCEVIVAKSIWIPG